MTYLNIVNNEFIIPKKIYHNCSKHTIIAIEDIDYDNDGNVMEVFNSEDFNRRETYKIYTCSYCGKVIRKERLQ